MQFNYKTKDLIKLIKARKKNNYKYLFNETIEMLRCLNGEFQKQKKIFMYNTVSRLKKKYKIN